MRSVNGKQAVTLKDEINRQLGSETTQRYLSAQPAFRTVEPIPQYLRDLLDRLDQAERASLKRS